MDAVQQIVDLPTQGTAIQIPGATPGEDDQIHPGQVAAPQAEGLAGDPLDAVALHGKPYVTLANRQPEAGRTGLLATPVQQRQMATADAPRVIEDMAVRPAGQQSGGAWKALADGVRRHAGRRSTLRRQTLAALGAARIDDLATATGGHAGTKTVGPRANESTGLKGALHGCSRDDWVKGR